MLFFLKKECAKCIVVIQPTLFCFLLLCLTIAEHNINISLAHSHRNKQKKKTGERLQSKRRKSDLHAAQMVEIGMVTELGYAKQTLSCPVSCTSSNKHACSTQHPCQYLSICCHCETLCIFVAFFFNMVDLCDVYHIYFLLLFF